MGCSVPGLLAVLSIAVAAILSSLSLGLPMWSTTTIEETGNSVNVDFVFGLWGYCNDLEVKKKHGSNDDTRHSGSDVEEKEEELAEQSTGQCFLYHSSNELDSHLEDSEMPVHTTRSLCEELEAFDASNRDKTETQRVDLALNLPGGQYYLFLQRSCGVTGNLALFCGVISAALGVLCLVFTTLSITCCKTKSVFVTLSKMGLLVAALTSLLTFLLWLAQVHPLTKGSAKLQLSASFILSILSMIVYAFGAFLVARHAKASSST